MAEFVADCPRCGSKRITFDVEGDHFLQKRYDWQPVIEAFSICRHCRKSTVFIFSIKESNRAKTYKAGSLHLGTEALNWCIEIEGFVSLKDMNNLSPPEYLPSDIESAFREAAACMAIGCFNAAATMFRLCIDHATRSRLPPDDVDGLSKQIRRSLGHRLEWLFTTKRLPVELKELSSCIKEDGNDGAHAGTLTKTDVEDISDFTFALLGRLYSEPARLEAAKKRRDDRRQGK